MAVGKIRNCTSFATRTGHLVACMSKSRCLVVAESKAFYLPWPLILSHTSAIVSLTASSIKCMMVFRLLTPCYSLLSYQGRLSVRYEIVGPPANKKSFHVNMR